MPKNEEFDLTAQHDPQENESLLSNTEELLNDEKEYQIRFEENSQETEKSNSNSNLSWYAAVMTLGSSFCFSICSFIVKYLKNVDPFELCTVRFMGILLPTTIIVICVNQNPLGPKGKRFVLILRAVFGAMTLMARFYAFRRMPLADATVIVFSSPVYVTILARIFLKEYFGIFSVVTVLLTICGVILISKPPFLFGSDVYQFGYSGEMMQGVVAALISTLFNAINLVLLRHLKDVHYSVVMLTFAIIAIVMSAGATYVFGEVSELLSINDWFIIILLAIFSFSGQILIIKALQLEQAGPIAIYCTLDIVFAFVWQSIFFHEVPNLFTIGGAFLVSISVIITGLRKWMMLLPNKSKLYERLKCLQLC